MTPKQNTVIVHTYFTLFKYVHGLKGEPNIINVFNDRQYKKKVNISDLPYHLSILIYFQALCNSMLKVKSKLRNHDLKT